MLRILASIAALLAVLTLPHPAQADHDVNPNRPTNEIPMYGTAKQDAARKAADPNLSMKERAAYQKYLMALEAADRKLIDTVKRSGQTRDAAADHSIKRGFEFFFRGDVATAIKRFNQAWLLSPDNGGAYWGFALVLDRRDHDFEGAIDMMEKAVELQPNNASLQKDFGLLYGRNGKHKQALERILVAQKMDPKLPYLHRELSTAYFMLEDIPSSLKHAKLSEAAGDKNNPRWMPLLTCLDEKMKGGTALIPAGKKCR